jgi:hypothetical protein
MNRPHITAAAFIRAVDTEDATGAWELLHVDCRLTFARRWLDDHAHEPAVQRADRETLTRALASGDPAHADFYELYRLHFSTLWPRPHRDWGWADKPRPIAPGLELVVFTNAVVAREAFKAAPDAPGVLVPAVRFYMRLDRRWSIAGLNEEPHLAR